MHILLAEDEPVISAHVKAALEGAGYLVTHCDNGPDTWERGGTENFDASILDLGLPGLDGLTLLKRWRAEGIEMPVLVLTARGSWMERVDEGLVLDGDAEATTLREAIMTPPAETADVPACGPWHELE